MTNLSSTDAKRLINLLSPNGCVACHLDQPHPLSSTLLRILQHCGIDTERVVAEAIEMSGGFPKYPFCGKGWDTENFVTLVCRQIPS